MQPQEGRTEKEAKPERKAVHGEIASSAKIPNSETAAAPWKVPWNAVAIFFLTACALAWLVDLPLWVGGVSMTSFAGKALIGLSMYMPAVAAFLVVMIVQHRRGRAIFQRLGWVPVRPMHRTVLFAVIGLFGSALLPIVTVFLAAALGLTCLDLVTFSGYAKLIASIQPAGRPLPMPISTLVLLQLAQLPFAALFNGLLTLGEETGWCGFLLPALRPLGTWPALIITGAAWGLWHAPIILLGYNFNRPNLFGLLLMVIGCIAYGVLVGWLRIRSGNICPSVIAHGAFNAAGAAFLLFSAAGAPSDPAIVGPLGWMAWIVMAAIAMLLVLTHQLPSRKQWSR